MKKFTIAIMMFALMALLVACGGEKEADKEVEKDTSADTPVETPAEEVESDVVSVTHELDNDAVEVKKNPEKVVVFDFGTLDTLDELGVDIVGLPQTNVPGYLSKYDDEKYVNVGSLKEPDFEAIHALQPDLIIISGRQSELYEEFKEIGPTIFVGIDTANYMTSFQKNLETMGEIFGKEDQVASELAEIDDQIAAINEKATAVDAKSLIILGSEGKVSAYGPSSRFGIIHDVFGFKAADEKIESSTHGQNITFEYILETNPDILFVVDRDAAIGTESTVKASVENDLVKKTEAFKNDKIVYLNGEYWYLSGGGLLSMKEMIKEVEAVL